MLYVFIAVFSLHNLGSFVGQSATWSKQFKCASERHFGVQHCHNPAPPAGRAPFTFCCNMKCRLVLTLEHRRMGTTSLIVFLAESRTKQFLWCVTVSCLCKQQAHQVIVLYRFSITNFPAILKKTHQGIFLKSAIRIQKSYLFSFAKNTPQIPNIMKLFEWKYSGRGLCAKIFNEVVKFSKSAG